MTATFFFFFSFFYLSYGHERFAYMNVCAAHTCVMLAEIRRGHQITRTGVRWLWTTMSILGTEPWSPVSATTVLHHQAISQATFFKKNGFWVCYATSNQMPLCSCWLRCSAIFVGSGEAVQLFRIHPWSTGLWGASSPGFFPLPALSWPRKWSKVHSNIRVGHKHRANFQQW